MEILDSLQRARLLVGYTSPLRDTRSSGLMAVASTGSLWQARNRSRGEE